jgi:hypothetical protein
MRSAFISEPRPLTIDQQHRGETRRRHKAVRAELGLTCGLRSLVLPALVVAQGRVALATNGLRTARCVLPAVLRSHPRCCAQSPSAQEGLTTEASAVHLAASV